MTAGTVLCLRNLQKHGWCDNVDMHAHHIDAKEESFDRMTCALSSKLGGSLILPAASPLSCPVTPLFDRPQPPSLVFSSQSSCVSGVYVAVGDPSRVMGDECKMR